MRKGRKEEGKIFNFYRKKSNVFILWSKGGKEREKTMFHILEGEKKRGLGRRGGEPLGKKRF